MKKIIFLFLVGISVFLFVSCLFSTEHYLIKQIEFFAVELINPTANDKDKQFVPVDTVRNNLYFKIVGIPEYQYGYLQNTSLISTCYATSVPEEIDNEIIITSIELALDSDIYLGGDVIAKNTNLWNHPILKDYQWHYVDIRWLGYCLTFGFTDEFYEKIAIPQKKYTIKFSCKTSDGQEFGEFIELFIKL